MTARRENEKMTTKALVKAIIRILELNKVDEAVISQIRELIE